MLIQERFVYAQVNKQDPPLWSPRLLIGRNPLVELLC